MIEFISSIILTLLICKLMSSTSYYFIIFVVSYIFTLFLHVLYENWLEVRLYRNRQKKISLWIENINLQQLEEYKNNTDQLKSRLATAVDFKGPFDISNPAVDIKTYIKNDEIYQRNNTRRTVRNRAQSLERW